MKLTEKEFIELVSLLETTPKSPWIEDNYNINLYNSIELLLKVIYTKDQYDWFDWWVWENDFGRNKYKATYIDIDNKEKSINTVEDLYYVINSIK